MSAPNRAAEDLADLVPLALAELDPQGSVRRANRTWAGFGLSVRPGRPLAEWVVPDDRGALEHALVRATTTAGPRATAVRFRRDDGTPQSLTGTVTAHRDAHGRVHAFAVALDDPAAAPPGGSDASRLAAVVEMTDDLVGITDAEGRVAYMNRAARERFGVGDRPLHEVTTADLFSGDAFERYYHEVRPRLVRGESWNGELEMRTMGGEPIPVWLSVVAGTGPGGEIEWLATVGRDVTTRRAHEAELARRAIEDPLTGLANRSHLLEHLAGAIDRAASLDRPVGVLFVDLDRFKLVNDRLGHETGDVVLREIAHRIRDSVRPGDLVARLGGDEFVVVCEGIDRERALGVARRIVRAVSGDAPPTGMTSTPVIASVGVAHSHPASNAEGLLREADAAMYAAKQAGRGGVVEFDESLRGHLVGRHQLARDLGVAISRHEVELLYQPLVDLQDATTMGFEVVPQWAHAERGRVGRDELLALADHTGLGTPLGLQIIRRACRQARSWELATGTVPRVHVAVPGGLVSEPALPEMVREVLADSDLDAHLMCVEVTDDELARSRAAVDVLRTLSQVGVAVAVRDVGSGALAFGAVRDASVDVLRIASRCVDELDHESDAAVVAAAIGVAHALEVWAVADGVRTRTQLARLRRLGCDGAQGGVFAPPLAAAAAGGLLQRRYALG